MTDDPNVHQPAAEEPWRIFRIMAEFVDGFDALSRLGPAVTVYGSARMGPQTPTYQQAVTLGGKLAGAGFAVLTGGGPGIMEAVNKGAKEAGGVSVGLNIVIPAEQEANPYLTHRIDFDYFFARKVMLVKYAQALICFPGGFGTMDECFESLTLIQTHKTHPSPVVLIDRKFWSPLVDWLATTLRDQYQTIGQEDLDLFHLTDDLDEAVAHVTREDRPLTPLWEQPPHRFEPLSGPGLG